MKRRRQRQHIKKKSLARYKVRWIRDEKNVPQAYVVPKPEEEDIPPSRLTEEAKAKEKHFINSSDYLLDAEGKPPKLTKKQKSKIKRDNRHKAKVHSINEKAELKAMAEGLERVVAKDNEECAFVGPIQQKTPDEQTYPSVKNRSAHNPPAANEILEQQLEGADEESLKLRTNLWAEQGLLRKANERVARLLKEKQKNLNEIAHLNRKIKTLEADSSSESNVRGFAEAHSLTKPVTLDSATILNLQEVNSQLKNDLHAMNRSIDYASEGNVNALLENIQQLEEDVSYLERKSLDDADYIQSLSVGTPIDKLQADNKVLLAGEYQRDEYINTLQEENDVLKESLDVYGEALYDSNTSKATLKQVAAQLRLYMIQHNEDPVRNFLRGSPHSIARTGELKRYLDSTAETRANLSNERILYQKWGKRFLETPNAYRRYKVLWVRNAPEREKQIYRDWGARKTTSHCIRRHALTGKMEWHDRINYAQWWEDNLTPKDAFRRDHVQSHWHKALKPLVEGWRSLKKNLNPYAIKREKVKIARIEASKVKRQAEALEEEKISAEVQASKDKKVKRAKQMLDAMGWITP